MKMELQPHTGEPRTTSWQSYLDFAELLQADHIPGLNVSSAFSFLTIQCVHLVYT